jgi:flavin-dependent dehydrogenase
MRVLRRFPYLEHELDRIVIHRLSRLYLEGPGGEAVLIKSDEPAALMIRRVEFDHLLVSMAIEAGAQLITNADVVQARMDTDRVWLTSRDGRRFDAPFVVAADGVHSTIARRLRLNPGWKPASVALDMMEETPRDALRDLDPSTLWVAYGYAGVQTDANGHNSGAIAPAMGACVGGTGLPTTAPEGYAYIFPKRDHVNIGIGYTLAYYRGAVRASPYELQRAFVHELRRRGLVEGDSVRGNFTPYLIPIGGPVATPARGRVLLAGDAGGFVNGFTAEGIYYAMVSGELAARAILESTGGSADSVADRYRRSCDHEIGTELRDSVLVQRYLFSSRQRLSKVIVGARRQPELTKLMVEVAIGRRSYGDLRRRMFAQSPVLATRLVWELMKKSFGRHGAALPSNRD